MDQNQASVFLMPTSSNPGERLANTGTTEAVSAASYGGSYISIQVGAVPVRVTINGNSGSTTQVAATDLRLPAESLWNHACSSAEGYVHCEAADGSSAYEMWLWKSSP